MVGIVRDFQIVVVQLNTLNRNKSQYVECWAVEFNGSKEYHVPFYLKGYAEYPTVDVGNSNNVIFNTIQYGCEDTLAVQMKNISGHFVEYV